MTSTRILFVDDEASILDGMRRMLRQKCADWDIAFADNGAAALDLIDGKSFDTIVTDMRMPGMNGAQLLREIQKRAPDAVRIVLSGYTDEGLLSGAMGCAHRIIAKPCPAEVLTEAIERSLALRRYLGAKRLTSVITRMSPLPLLPKIYAELTAALEDDVALSTALDATLVHSPEATSQFLELANALCFSSHPTMTGVSQVAGILGVDTIRALALSIGLFAHFRVVAAAGSSHATLVEHSYRVALAARRIAAETGCPLQSQAQAFMAGLLHDIGRLLLIAREPDEYERAGIEGLTHGLSISDAERRVLGVTHGAIGGHVLLPWGLPDPVTEAVTYHHEPMAAGKPETGPLVSVHIANVQDSVLCDLDSGLFAWDFDWDLIDALQLGPQIEGWRSTPAPPDPASSATVRNRSTTGKTGQPSGP